MNRQGFRIVFAVLILVGSWSIRAAAEPAHWNVDPEHSTVEFRVAHMVVSKTTGYFTDYQGYIDMDSETGTVKAIEATIKTASVTTKHEKRDAHLRNTDFFDVEKYPTMTYRMKHYKKTADGYEAVGELTLRGVTQGRRLNGELQRHCQGSLGQC